MNIHYPVIVRSRLPVRRLHQEYLINSPASVLGIRDGRYQNISPTFSTAVYRSRVLTCSIELDYKLFIRIFFLSKVLC